MNAENQPSIETQMEQRAREVNDFYEAIEHREARQIREQGFVGRPLSASAERILWWADQPKQS